MTIELLEDGAPVGTVFDGPMSAEINSSGAVVYGYNWGTKGKKFAPAPGTYRLTFAPVLTTITGIAATAALNVPTFEARSTSLVITLTSGNSGGGGGGGGGPGGPPN